MLRFVLSHLVILNCLVASASLQADMTGDGQGLNHITPNQLSVVVNLEDELSVAIGDYYQQQRKIPAQNIIRVRFPPALSTMTPEQFAEIKRRVDAQTPEQIQAYLLTWTAPYRVACMSMTSAFAFGFSRDYCSNGCALTKPNPYAGSLSGQPYTDYRIRPTMMLAASNLVEAKALIDRGVSADNSEPIGSTLLVYNEDKLRNVRSFSYSRLEDKYLHQLNPQIIKSRGVAGRDNILFYFIGAVRVENLETLGFVPGAIADHLTSTGGIPDGKQMPASDWLAAGATGTYGNVVEPCNYLEKFPDPDLVMGNYLSGSTLIEAYWKSVKMPGQGVFLGEPLARPFSGQQADSAFEVFE